MNINYIILLIWGSAMVALFAWWLGFEMAELKMMPHLECDFLKIDLDYYDRAQAEWVRRCYDLD